MTLYRPHRGMLADSMACVAEVESFEALVNLMREEVADYYPPDQMPTLENTTIEPYGGFDKRIGWDTHIVLVNGSAWGFTNGLLPPARTPSNPTIPDHP